MGGGVDLQDSWDRLFTSGKYQQYRPGIEDSKSQGGDFANVLENFNPFGKSIGETTFSLGNPLGLQNREVGRKNDTEGFSSAWTQWNQDNPIGRNTTFEKQQQGWSRDKAIGAGSDTTGNTAGTILAAIFGGAALAGGSSGGAAAGGSSAGAAGGSGAAAGGTAAGGSAGAGSAAGGVNWQALAQKGIGMLGKMGGGQQDQYQQDDGTNMYLKNYYDQLAARNSSYYSRGY